MMSMPWWKSFKDLWRSLKICMKILVQIFEDLYKKSSRIYKDLWGSSRFLPRSSIFLPKIFKDPRRSLKIYKDLCRIFVRSLKIFAGILKILVKSLKIFARSSKISAWIFKIFVRSLKIFAGIFKIFARSPKIFALIFKILVRSLKVFVWIFKIFECKILKYLCRFKILIRSWSNYLIKIIIIVRFLYLHVHLTRTCKVLTRSCYNIYCFLCIIRYLQDVEFAMSYKIFIRILLARIV